MGDCRGVGKRERPASEGPAPAARCSHSRGLGLVLSLCHAGPVEQGQSCRCGDLPVPRGVPSGFSYPKDITLPRATIHLCAPWRL